MQQPLRQPPPPPLVSLLKAFRTLLLLAFMAASSTAHGWDMDRVWERSIAVHQPDRSALMRLQSWRDMLDRHQPATTATQLNGVNSFFNRHLVFADDLAIWGQADYWATPVESLVNGAADCEDFTIAKYFSLKKLGVPDQQLRLIYVKALELDQAHMVLGYYPTPLSEPLILDNLTDRILPASARSDLVPVYSFNSQGLWLPGKADERRIGSSRNLPHWRDLARKMRDEGFDVPLRTTQ